MPVPVAVPAPVPIQPIPYAPQMPTNQQLQPIGADQSNGNRLPTDQGTYNNKFRTNLSF